MNIFENIEDLLVSTLINELKWFMDEIDELYLFTEIFSTSQIKQANQIINFLKERMEVADDELLKKTVAQSIENVQRRYPELFTPAVVNILSTK